MDKTKWQIKSLYPFLRRVAVALAAIIIIAGLYWWFVGAHTNERLETNLFVTGSAAVIIGAFMRKSSREGTYSTMFSQPYAGSSTSTEDRLQQSSEDLEHSWSDLMVASQSFPGVVRMKVT
jgi:hypothetical protein